MSAAIDAAEALERLAREQQAAPPRFSQCRDESAVALVFVALATSRGEAARAVEALWRSLTGTVSRATAYYQAIELGAVAAIPSATLLTWAAGWRAYEATS